MRISDWSSDVCSSDLAFGALLHYVLIISAVGVVIWLLSFPMGAIGGRVGFGRFVRAVSSSQAVALSTQSSLASLPAMRSEERRVGKEGVSKGRSRWLPYQ